MICRNGSAKQGRTTVTLERDGFTMVVKNVPARVCSNCGEAYVDDRTAGRLLRNAGRQARAGAQVEIRQFAAA